MATYPNLGVLPHVQKAADHFGTKHGIKRIGGYRKVGSVPGSDHPKRRALDFMVHVSNNKAKGDALAADLIANAGAFGLTYVIWNRRQYHVNEGKWRPYTGPSPHIDHVHASFGGGGGSGIINADNPLIPNQLEDPYRDIKRIVEFFTDAGNWRKVAFYSAGALLIVFGAIALAGLSTPGVKDVVKVAKKVAVK